MPTRDMLINYVPQEECRIAITEDGRLEEFYQERVSADVHVGNIYKGRVNNIESSIQAAFIDFGLERNGFLHVTDLHPMYFPRHMREAHERVGKKTAHHERPPIQQCLRKGQEILVQVLKEGLGSKGPTVTSYLSIPGRFIVMMPFMKKLGVSRKIEDEDLRRELKQTLTELSPPEDLGFIIRTAGIGQTKADLKRDLAYLARLWKMLEARREKTKGIGELYTESDLIIRTLRDVYSSDIDRIILDDPRAARRAREFLSLINPRCQTRVIFYNDPVPIFHRFGIEPQIETIHGRQVPLPSGGYLIIDQTEALVAIDVNSGKSRDAKDAETNAVHTNMEAVDEIARQLRLRDLGGVVVNDLIDMRDTRNRRKVETRFRDNLKRDRARTRIAAISPFGVLEMTRQRMRPSLEAANTITCPHCDGTGSIKSAESVVLEVMRRLALAMHRPEVERIELTISPDAAFQLLNRRRQQLVAIERRFGKSVMVRVGGNRMDHIAIHAIDTRGVVMDPERFETQITIGEPVENAFVELDDPRLDDLQTVEDGGEQEDPLAVLEGLITTVTGHLADPHAAEEAGEGAEGGEGDQEAGGGRKRKRRRRRRGSKSESSDAAAQDAPPQDTSARDQAPSGKPTTDRQATTGDDPPGKRHQQPADMAPARHAPTTQTPANQAAAEHPDPSAESTDESAPRKKRRRRRGGRGRGGGRDHASGETGESGPAERETSADQSTRPSPPPAATAAPVSQGYANRILPAMDSPKQEQD